MPRPKGLPKTGGRQPGSCNVKTRAIADRAAAEGILPLDVMLMDMRAKLDAGDLAGAADRARDCAAYMHPRLTTSNVTVRRLQSLTEISDAELAALAGEAGTADAAVGPGTLN